MISDPICTLSIQPIIGDGNCFFYAVSHQRFRNSSNSIIKHEAINLRQAVVDFIEANLDDFENWLDVNPSQSENYLITIRKNGQMVSSECIAAASRLLDRKIWIYQVNLPLLKYELNDNGNLDLPPIFLFYRNLHYESVVNLDPSSYDIGVISSTLTEVDDIESCVHSVVDKNLNSIESSKVPFDKEDYCWIDLADVNWKVKIGKKGSFDETFDILFKQLTFVGCKDFASANDLYDKIGFSRKILNCEDLFEILYLSAVLSNRIILLFSRTGKCRKFLPLKKQGKCIFLFVDDLMMELAEVISYKRIHDVNRESYFISSTVYTIGGILCNEFIMPKNDNSLFSAICHQMSGFLPSESLFNELVLALKVDVKNSGFGNLLSANLNGSYLQLLNIICNIIKSKVSLWENDEIIHQFIPTCIDSHVHASNIILKKNGDNMFFNSLIFANNIQLNNKSTNVSISSLTDTSIPVDVIDSNVNDYNILSSTIPSVNTIDSNVINPHLRGVIFLKIATLNVRGCCSLDKRIEINDCLLSFGVDVAVLQEVNLDGSTASSNNYDWYISDRSSANKSRGLAFLIKKNSDFLLSDLRTINCNIMSGKVLCKFNSSSLLLVNVHAPNSNSSNFFTTLGNYVNKNPLKDRIVLLGDFNAHVGKDDLENSEKKFFGAHIGHNLCNANGEFFKALVMLHDLKCYSMNFNDSLLVTWSNGVSSSQVDHIVASSRPSFKINQIKAFWTELNVDHKLLFCKLKFGSCHEKCRDMKHKTLVDPSYLQFKEFQDKFHLNLKNSEKLNYNTEDVNVSYDHLSRKLNSAAKSALSTVNSKLTPIRMKALKRLQKSQMKARFQKGKGIDISFMRREIQINRQSYKLAVRDHCEKIAIDFFNNLNNFEPSERNKRTYKFLKKFIHSKNNFASPVIPLSHWNRELEVTLGNDISIEPDIEVIGQGPSKLEIKEIINSLMNGKACGEDKIKNEYLKYADDEVLDDIWKIMSNVWANNKIPDVWRNSIQIPIPKKKGAKVTNEFRRITLCNLGYKIYATWLKSRLHSFIGDPGYHQAAFIRNRSTDDQVFITRRLLEERWNAGFKTFVASLDISKAFDRVEIHCIKDILRELNVPHHLIQRICNALNSEKTKVLWQGVFSREFVKNRGIKQGCSMSPFLFILIIQWVLIEVKKIIKKLNLLDQNNMKLPIILAFADDLLVITNSVRDLDLIIKHLKMAFARVGLEINKDKSNILIRDPSKDSITPNSLLLDNEPFPVVDKLRYLGSYLTTDLARPLTTRIRCSSTMKIAKMVIAFCKRYKPTWRLGKLMYKTVILPSMIYGFKTATILKRNRLSITRFENQIVREIWDSCRDRPSSSLSVSQLLDGKTAVKIIRILKICYWAHIQRRDSLHPLKLAANLCLNKKKKGRPSFTWRDSIIEVFKHYPEWVESDWIGFANDKNLVKRKAEHIYLIECSEEEDFDNSFGRKKFKKS